MTYKEFQAWCNERACDGCWSKETAITCIQINNFINQFPWWKRKKEWKKIKDEVEKNIVTVINERIKAVRG